MEVTAIMHVKNDTIKVSEKFQKRDFVVKTESTTPYPQFVTFQLNQDKCNVLDSFEIGQEVKVLFNLKGREYQNPNTLETKYFNTLDCWKIEKV